MSAVTDVPLFLTNPMEKLIIKVIYKKGLSCVENINKRQICTASDAGPCAV